MWWLFAKTFHCLENAYLENLLEQQQLHSEHFSFFQHQLLVSTWLNQEKDSCGGAEVGNHESKAKNITILHASKLSLPTFNFQGSEFLKRTLLCGDIANFPLDRIAPDPYGVMDTG